MFPHLFAIPLPFLDEPFQVRSFGVLVAIAFLFGAHLLHRLVARYGDDPEKDPERYSSILMWVLFGIFGGARLMYVVVEILRDSPTGQGYLDEPWTMFFFWEGGLVMYGGLAGGILAGIHRCKQVGVRWIHGLDMALVAAFFAQSIGRVGCLMVGDDYGSPVPEAFRGLPFPITVTVPDPLPDGSLFGSENEGVMLWATQPWMSINALILGFIAWRILRKRRYAGQVTLWLVLLYSITRYLIEIFRGDSIRGLWFDGLMSTSQLISVVAGIFAAVMLWRNRGRENPLPVHAPKTG